METNITKLMSIAIGGLIFIFGLTIFLNMYSNFMTSEVVYEDELSPDEKTLQRYYDKSDIFFAYSNLKEMREDEEFEINNYLYAEILVNGIKLDFSKEEEEILVILKPFANKKFEKTYSFNDDKLKKIIYTSR